MSSLKERALKYHENGGKLVVASRMPLENQDDLSLAYSPGVAEPCLEIAKDKELAYKYTFKKNTVAVITDGSAVLGLGNIGALEGLPVMEGKCLLLKRFADVDAIPICLDTQDTEEIIKTVKMIAPTLGGINLEDISAPRCVEIETRLQRELDIPIFHDDQHGTAIVTLAAIINSCRLTNRKKEDLRVVVCGTGAAGSSIINMLNHFGIKNIIAYDLNGIVHKSKMDKYDDVVKKIAEITNEEQFLGDDTLAAAMKGADVFVGVSAAGLVNEEMVKGMNKDPFIFAMANPTPEIMPDLAKKAGAYIVGTGRSDYPNQVNNVLAFPGIFRGALDSRARDIDMEMKCAAAQAIADVIDPKELTPDYIIPNPFDERVVEAVSKYVYEIGRKQRK